MSQYGQSSMQKLERLRMGLKPNTTLLYINILSNHPPTILKNIFLEVNTRLCRLSRTNKDFLAVKEPYQEALDKARHNNQLIYQEPDTASC